MQEERTDRRHDRGLMHKATIFVAAYDPFRAKAAMRQVNDHPVASVALDWTEGPFDRPYRERPEWAIEKAASIRQAIARSDALVLLWQPCEMESARWEAGMAVGLGLPVIVAGDVDLFYGYLPSVRVVADDEQAVRLALDLVA